MKKTALILAVGLVGSFGANASTSDYTGPGSFDPSKNQEVFSLYCIGEADSAAPADVNYANPDVMKAANILSKVADKSFYFYGDLKRIYAGGTPPQEISRNAHTFLRILCGDFRDRATLIAEKIKWVHNMVMPGMPEPEPEPEPEQPLSDIAPETKNLKTVVVGFFKKASQTLRGESQSTATGRPIDLNKNIWAQMTGSDYNKYLALSDRIWSEKQLARPQSKINFGNNDEADVVVEGTTVCEVKYMFSEYIAKGRVFSGFRSYQKGLESFSTEKCSSDDKDHYYDFRGDSNFKPNSPEANAMIWHSQSVAKNCVTSTKSKNPAQFPDSDCESYFRKPFLSRWTAARSALATWLMYDDSFGNQFADMYTPVTVLPVFGAEFGKKPFFFSLDGTTKMETFLPGASLLKADLGFNEAMGLGTASANKELAFIRLRNAVNRHTNWYQSRYNDLFQGGMKRDQAYSPFVASSYEMSKSNMFTQPGTTVKSEGDGRKHWMFVFRVHKSKWYHTGHLQKGLPFDPDTMWLDETSFGTDNLADSERAWDRLGTALEGELDSIIYLHNLDAGTGEPIANDQLN